MAAKLMILFACLALGHAALVRREAPALGDIQKHAEEFSKTFSEQLNNFIQSPDVQGAQKTLKESTDATVQHISELANSIQAAIADATGKTKEVLEQSKANLDQVVGKLRQEHPEVEQQASQLGNKLQSAVQTSLAETQKVAKTIQDNVEQTNQKLGPKFQEIYNDFVKSAQDVQKKLHEAATKQ